MAVNRRRKRADLVILIKAGVFLVVIVLAVFLMLSIMKLANGPAGDASETSSGASTSAESSGDDVSEVDESLPTNTTFTPVTVENDKVHMGNLILVNSLYPYEFPVSEEESLVEVYKKKTGDYKIADSNVMLQPQMVDAMNEMMKAYTQLYSKKDLTIVGAYRSSEDQQKLYNDRVKRLGEEKASKQVAKPGQSDNHTGLAMSLKIVTSTSVDNFNPAGDYAWVAENAFRYGFVQRFRSDKELSTGMEGIDGYYRYVGLPHSYIMNVGNLSLEEYVVYIKTFRYDGDMLTQEFDGKTYKVYYFPADSGASTSVPVPSDASEYRIEGNNIDGFVVTAVYE